MLKKSGLVLLQARKLSKLSYSYGNGTVPLVSGLLPQVLQEAVEKKPDREAVIFKHQGIKKTYEQFHKDVSTAY